MAPEDAFCPECGTHVVDQARITGDASPARAAASSSAPPSDSAYDRPYERLDDMQPARPAEPPESPVDDNGEPQPIRTFDAPVEADEEDEYADYTDTQEPRFSPVMLGLAAVLIAIILAGVIIAFFGGSGDDSGSSGSLGDGGSEGSGSSGGESF